VQKKNQLVLLKCHNSHVLLLLLNISLMSTVLAVAHSVFILLSPLNDNLFITQFNFLSDAYDNFARFYVALRS